MGRNGIGYIAFPEHCDDELVIGDGLVREAVAIAVDGDKARLGAIS